MDDSRAPRELTSVFEAARLGWNVRMWCPKCGHVRVLAAAAVWLKLFQRGRPDDIRELERRGCCTDCLQRREKIRPKIRLVRDPPTGEALPLPTERQWKEGLAWQRR